MRSMAPSDNKRRIGNLPTAKRWEKLHPTPPHEDAYAYFSGGASFKMPRIRKSFFKKQNAREYLITTNLKLK